MGKGNFVSSKLIIFINFEAFVFKQALNMNVISKVVISQNTG